MGGKRNACTWINSCTCSLYIPCSPLDPEYNKIHELKVMNSLGHKFDSFFHSGASGNAYHSIVNIAPGRCFCGSNRVHGLTLTGKSNLVLNAAILLPTKSDLPSASKSPANSLHPVSIQNPMKFGSLMGA